MPNSSSRTSIGRISTRRNWQSASIFISIATDASEPSRNDQQVIFLVQDLDGETHPDRSCLDGCRHPLPGLRGLGLFALSILLAVFGIHEILKAPGSDAILCPSRSPCISSSCLSSIGHSSRAGRILRIPILSTDPRRFI